MTRPTSVAPAAAGSPAPVAPTTTRRHAFASTPFDTRRGPLFAATVAAADRRLMLSGEFDVAAVDAFTAAAAQLPTTPHDVTVDLTGVDFLDAAGLGALVTLRNTLTTAGRGLTLIGVRPAARRVFHAGNLADLLPDAG